MSDLGTLTAHQLRPGARHPNDTGRDRSAATHHLRPFARMLPAIAQTYLTDWAHYPVRLNGRACEFTPGICTPAGAPWIAESLPQTDANGRRYHFAHAVSLQWTAGAGSRTITAHVWHQHASGATPRLRIPAQADLGLAEQIATAGTEIDTEHILTLSFTMPTQATITVLLENTNTQAGIATTWGDISVS